MWELSEVLRLFVTGWIVLALLAFPETAAAWIENRAEASDTRLTIEKSGKAVVQYRVRLHTNGNERFKQYRIRGVDPAARPLPHSYVVPASDALSGSLDAAVPLRLSIRQPRKGREEQGAELQIDVDDERGLRRGRYVLVLRYETDLRQRGLIQRDGSLLRIRYPGLRFEDGLPNARATFVLPAAPTAPRAIENLEHIGRGDDVTVPSVYLSEVRRGAERDEVEILRSYAPAGESVPWIVRVDQRSLDPLPRLVPILPERHDGRVISLVRKPHARVWIFAIGGLLFIVYALLVVLKARSVARVARKSGAYVRPVIPMPLALRAVLSAAAVVVGIMLQLVVDWPVWGAVAVVAGSVLAAHGRARVERAGALRGPGRWLSVSEREALVDPPRPCTSWLDWSTRAGKICCLLSLTLLGIFVALITPEAPWHATLLGFDAVALLALFGTAMESTMPPDRSVEPAGFLRSLSKRLRAMPIADTIRLVPRIRIPHGAIDPDELRLLVVPRVPLRGFNGIEVGICYVLGTGARVAMPEVLLRVVGDSPCDHAVASISRVGRITPGRRVGERVIAVAPRLPTVRMTAEIVSAIAARVIDREAVQQAPPRAATAVPVTKEPPKPDRASDESGSNSDEAAA